MRRVRLLPALLLLLVAGCGGEPAPPPPPAGPPAVETLTLGGAPAVVVTPTQPNGRVVLYLHGVGETERAILESRELKPLVDALLEEGYTVAGSAAAGDAWGNAASVQAYTALALALQGRGLQLFTLAQSMGGAAAMQLVDVVRPLAWAAIFPVCDVNSVRFLGRFRQSIDTAWPQGPPGPIRPRNVSGLRMTFWHSPEDTIVTKAENTDVCAANARQDGADVRVIETTGDHGDPSNFDPQQLLEAFG